MVSTPVKSLRVFTVTLWSHAKLAWVWNFKEVRSLAASNNKNCNNSKCKVNGMGCHYFAIYWVVNREQATFFIETKEFGLQVVLRAFMRTQIIRGKFLVRRHLVYIYDYLEPCLPRNV